MAVGPSDKDLHAFLVAFNLEEKFDNVFIEEYVGYRSIEIGIMYKPISNYIKNDIVKILIQTYKDVGWYYVDVNTYGNTWSLTLIADEDSYNKYIENSRCPEYRITTWR